MVKSDRKKKNKTMNGIAGMHILEKNIGTEVRFRLQQQKKL